MVCMKGALAACKRRKKVLKLAKGYWGAKNKHFKMTKQAVMKSGSYAYIGRKHRKEDFRRLWITHISAVCKMNDVNCFSFMSGLEKADITFNHEMLSEIAVSGEAASRALVEEAKAALQ